MKSRIVLAALAMLLAVTGCLTGDDDDEGGGAFWALPCEDPAVFEPPGAGADYAGYVVEVREGLDVVAEAARIGVQCVVPVDEVYIGLFFTIPKVDDATIACLRCDPAVVSIWTNLILQPL